MDNQDKFIEEGLYQAARAGDIVVFSSLTPHCTGPNKTYSTRKTFILQYAPNGAVRYPPFSEKEEANNPERQFFINKKP